MNECRARASFGALVAVITGMFSAGCQDHFANASLVDSISRMGLELRALDHLKGCEDPKLKALLERDLVFSVATARYFVDHGAKMGPIAAVNLAHTVHDVSTYATEHHLDALPVVQVEGFNPDLLGNLRVVEARVDALAETAKRADAQSRRSGATTEGQ